MFSIDRFADWLIERFLPEMPDTDAAQGEDAPYEGWYHWYREYHLYGPFTY